MGGDHRYAIAPDEVVFAALTLYTDVMAMFTYILRIIGLSRNMWSGCTKNLCISKCFKIKL